MAVGYHYFSGADFGGSPGTNVTANLGGTATAGDIIIVNAVGGSDGGGLGLPNLVGGGAAPTWIKIFDENHGASTQEYRETVWYCICLGGENQVFGVWPSSANKGIECLWISDPAGLNEVYVMGSDHEVNNANQHWNTPGYNPSSDGEIYVGFTANGRDSYTFADMNVNGGGADSGDGFSLGSAPKAIMHHHANTHTHVMADSVGYSVNNTIPDVTMGVLGVRTASLTDPPVNTVSPFIDNTSPQVGDTLTGDPGTWTGDGVITYTYQWLNYDGTDHNLFGETAITYVVTEDVVGTAIWLDVRAHSDFVAEPGVEAVSDHTDNVIEASSTDYTDAATATLVGVVSANDTYERAAVTSVFDVGDHSVAQYVRAGRANLITVATADNPITFQVQVSPDGEAWYDLINGVIDINNLAALAFSMAAGLFYFRLMCTVADDGPATVAIRSNGGY